MRFVILTGISGAGKSTAFKAVLGLIHIDGGNIEILGKNQRNFTTQDKEGLGVVLAESSFNGMLTIKDAAAVMDAMFHKFKKKRFFDKCSQYGLPVEKPLKDFSTGMYAKFKLLAAMSHEARLLILDEPTVGLDSVARKELLDEMRQYMEEEGRAILISSHISGDLETLCDDIYMIHEGKIILHEDTDVLLDHYALLKADSSQFIHMDKQYILRFREESFGYSCLTDQKQYYVENFPGLVIEKGTIDNVITMMIRGEKAAKTAQK